MKRALTARTIEIVKPSNTRREIPDAHMPGLYLIVQPSGSKSWAVRYRSSSITRKYTLGAFPAIDLKTARALAGKALRAVAEGRDPGHEKAQARSTKIDSIEHVAAQFIERHCKRANRQRTAEETERLLRLHVLPHWRGRTINSICRRDVLEILDRITDAGTPIAANRTLSAARKMFNWCIARDIIAVSPCSGVKPPTVEHSRDRVLNDDELHATWLAADNIGFPFGPMVQMLICTGQRRDEVAKMEWNEIDFEKKLWTLPRERVKTNEKHEVPLSDIAVAILKRLPRIAGARFVFTTTGNTAASAYSKNKRRLDVLLPPDMPPWRLHDLRRTAASGMARLGINLPIIEKVLNHASGSFAGIVAVYQRHSFSDEKRKALEAWGRFINDLIGTEIAGKVVRLTRP
jgi:integrase